MSRFLVALAIAVSSLLVTPGADARTPTVATSGGQFTGEGFDKCVAPPSSALRSWLASPYRAVNIYMGGINRACANQPELTPQWISTVTTNGWSIIPTYVGSQARCTTSSKTYKITASTAAEQGTQEADDAAAQMAALGMPPNSGNPVYFDMEPYPVDSSHTTCNNAVLTFFDAWTRELHLKGYVSGIYGTTRSVMKQLVSKQGDVTFQQPDAIWYADWNGEDTTTGETGIPDEFWVGHRIHQYRGGHNETFSSLTFNIDNDAIDGDVVSAVTPSAPSGPPYHFAAAPPSGTTLKERSTPETTPDNKTGVVYQSGADLAILCQTVGEKIDGSFVWDKLQDGSYVSDIFTTTTGGLSFTSGVPRCDTTKPIATMTPITTETLAAAQTFTWTGTDEDSGVATYQVRYRRAPWNGPFHHWRYPDQWRATTSTSGLLPLSAGFTYCAQVRATDRSGNVSPWSTAVCTAKALDDSKLTGGSAWKHLTGNRYYLHTATATHTPTATLHLAGASVARVGIVASVCARCGDVRVIVDADGQRIRHRFSLQSPTSKQRQIFMLAKTFSLRTAEIRIRAVGDPALVRIDGVVVGHV